MHAYISSFTYMHACMRACIRNNIYSLEYFTDITFDHSSCHFTIGKPFVIRIQYYKKHSSLGGQRVDDVGNRKWYIYQKNKCNATFFILLESIAIFSYKYTYLSLHRINRRLIYRFIIQLSFIIFR